MGIIVRGRGGLEVEEVRGGDAAGEGAHCRWESKRLFDEGGGGHGERRCVLDAASALLTPNSRRSPSSHGHEPDPFRRRRPVKAHQFQSIAQNQFYSYIELGEASLCSIGTSMRIPNKLLHYARRCLARCSFKQATTRCFGYFGAAGKSRYFTSRRTASGSGEGCQPMTNGKLLSTHSLILCRLPSSPRAVLRYCSCSPGGDYHQYGYQ